MKNTFLVLFFLSTKLAFTQNLDSYLISSCGSFNLTGPVRVHWAIGEIAVNTYNTEIILTEGFYQVNNSNISNSINSQLDFDVIIYPNPFQEYISIRFNRDENLDLEIFDLLGKIVFKKSKVNNEMKIDMQNLSKGAYLVKVYDLKNKFSSFKLIKI